MFMHLLKIILGISVPLAQMGVYPVRSRLSLDNRTSLVRDSISDTTQISNGVDKTLMQY